MFRVTILIAYCALVNAALTTFGKPSAYVKPKKNTFSGNQFSCDLFGSTGNRICELQGLTTIDTFSDDSHLQDVRTVRIIYSQIDELPVNVCNRFGSQLEVLDIWRSGIRSADRNSISNCTNLLVINLFGNNLRELPLELFSRNMKLIQIRLAENSLERLPDEIFSNNQDLELIDLTGNNLATFSPNLVVGLKKLHTLILDANELMNLDAAAIVKEATVLRSIYLDYNLFPCSVLNEIVTYLLNVTQVEDVKSTGSGVKSRDETLSSVLGIQCVSEEIDDIVTTTEEESNFKNSTELLDEESATSPSVSALIFGIAECTPCLEALFSLNCATFPSPKPKDDISTSKDGVAGHK